MNEVMFDELGPEKILQLYDPKNNFKAFVVIDNTVLGPAIGGVRVSPAVTIEEVARLARTMTLKNSIAGLPHGGGKAAIITYHKDPSIEDYFRLFAKDIKYMNEYIPGPDMGSNEESMAWIYEETGRAVGLPERLGGLPLDKLGATGFGLAECAEVACPFAGIDLYGAKVAVHGFGSVGKAAARFLFEKGALLVGASDTQGTIYNPEGINVSELISIKESSKSVIGYKHGKIRRPDDVFSLECDILIPAATPDVISMKNIDSIKARLILQGANIPATKEAEKALHEKGILCVPDFIANAGGVIMAAMEYAKKVEKEAFEAISVRIKANTKIILETSKIENMLPRQAAENIAKERILKAI